MDSNLLGRAVQNSLHIPAFAVLAYFLASAWRSLSPLAVLSISLLLAVLLESSQIFTDRDASAVDLVADAGGALLGVWIARGSRFGRGCGVVLLVLVTSWMPLPIWKSYVERDRSFPVLMGAGSVGSSLFSSNSEVTVVSDGADEQSMLRVCWRDVQYPGVQMIEVVPDWSSFNSFLLEFEVEPSPVPTVNGATVALFVAVGHRNTPGTSAFVSAEFLPGRHRWEIPRPVLDHDEAAISHLIVHSSPEHVGRCIRIAQVVLK